MQVGHCYRADRVRVQPLGLQRHQAGGAAIDQQHLPAVIEVDACLPAPAAAEGITAAHEPHPHGIILTHPAGPAAASPQRQMSGSAERVCDGLKAGGRGGWLLWTGAPSVTAMVPPPFQLCTAEQRAGPGRCCSPSTSMVNGSPFAEPETGAPPTTG